MTLQTPSSSTPEAFEPLVEMLSGGEIEILHELIDLYLDDTPPRLEQLREAVAQNNIEQIDRMAHSLKGSCGSIGAMVMSAMSAEIERLARTGETPIPVDLVTRLEHQFQSARAQLLEMKVRENAEDAE